MQDNVAKELIIGALKVVAVIAAIIGILLGILVGDHVYKLHKYGEPPTKTQEVTCVEVRYRRDGDMFIFEDKQGTRYTSSGLTGIIEGDTAELLTVGDNINYSYSYVINGTYAVIY